MRVPSDSYAARDLLLNALGYPDYAAYLRSPRWAAVRRAFYARPGSRKCRLCPAPAAVVHHLAYGRPVLLGRDLRPLVPLCERCHERVEFTPAGRKRSLREARAAYALLAGKVRLPAPIPVSPRPTPENRPGKARRRLKRPAAYPRALG